jgi:zinc transport system ATP-binding protein
MGGDGFTESAPVLAVERLTVYREDYAAVQEVSFTLQAGTDMAIVGPNGAGKSSLIQALLGILPRQAGQVTILGQPLPRSGRWPTALQSQIAYLPQSFMFDRYMPITVTELVGLGWDQLGWQVPWGRARSRSVAVRQALSRVGAMHLRQKVISGLSGGEMKRVLLAYCLVQPRKLLILDEAPAGLDFQGEAEFYQLLYQLKQEQGWAILQVSHDLNMVRRNCDHVLCLNRTLRCQGTPAVALSATSLAAAYGAQFAPYQHTCH